MKKNSTSTIVRRSLLVIAFIALTHVFARAAWHFQLFGLNTPDGWDQVCTTQESSDGLTYEMYCQMAQKTSFWQYTGDTWTIIGTHFAGALLAAAVFGLVYWIAFYSNHYDRVTNETELMLESEPPREDRFCPCVWHTADTYSGGSGATKNASAQIVPVNTITAVKSSTQTSKNGFLPSTGKTNSLGSKRD
jgi:hypothetical protein